MGVLTWGLFLLLKPLAVTPFKTSGLSREARVWISCITVGIGLLLLTVGGGDPLTTHNLFQEIAVGFWLIVGCFIGASLKVFRLPQNQTRSVQRCK